MKTIIPLLSLLLLTIAAQADVPPGFKLVKGSSSPDGRFSVIEPSASGKDADDSKAHAQLLETKSGKAIGSIEGVAGLAHMNRGGVAAKWNKESSLLLWFGEGKWGPHTVTFVATKDGAISKQADLVKAGYAEILKRAKKAHPKAYAAAVKQNEGSGSALPDGFVACVALEHEDAAKLPARFVVTIASNAKGIEDYPKAAELEAYLFGVLDEHLNIQWGEFGAFDDAKKERMMAEGEGAGEVIAHEFDAVLTATPASGKAKLQAAQDAWEKQQTEIDGTWPIARSLCTSLNEKLRSDATMLRVKELGKLLKKK